MKKFIRFLCISGLLAAMLLGLCAFDKNGTKIYDYSNILSDSDKEELLNKILELDEKYALDIIIVSTDDLDEKSYIEYADDFYDQGGFGNGDKNSGALLLLDFDSRNVYFSTAGTAIDEINDVEIEVILDDIFEYMPDGDYLNACMAFLNGFEYAYTSSDYDNVSLSDYKEDPDSYKTEEDWLSPIFGDAHPTNGASVLRLPYVTIPIAAVISLIVVAIMAAYSKPKMTAGGSTYMDKNSFKMKNHSDVFIGRHTVTRHIESSGGGGGSHGGSSHISSGGVRHGGGGRSF